MCHQMDERALSAAGFTMPLCSRCAGLYLAVFLALPLFIFYCARRRTTVFTPFVPLVSLAALAWAADGVANFFGLWQTPNVLRFATGAALGISLSPFLASLFLVTLDESPATAPACPWRLLPVALAVVAALTTANVRPPAALLVLESYAAAAGVVMLLLLVHTALWLLILQRRHLPLAVSIALVTIAAQIVLFSSLRGLVNI